MGILSECLVLLLLCQALHVFSTEQSNGEPKAGGGGGEAALQEEVMMREFQPGEEVMVDFVKRGGSRKQRSSPDDCDEPAEKKASTQKALNKNILEWHNYYRCLHGVGSLKYSTKLEKEAKKNVDMNVRSEGMKHSDFSYGENLWATWGMGGSVAFKKTTGKMPVFAWYNEMNNPGYNWGSRPTMFSSGTGHFTQVVWKATKEVGCYTKEHKMRSGWDRVFTACVYNPAGNMNMRPQAKNIENWNTNVPPPL